MKSCQNNMNNRAQTILELCLVFVITILGFLAMRAYFSDAIQGSWKKNMDTISEEQYSLNATREEFPDEKDGEPAIVFENSKITIEGEGVSKVEDVSSGSGIRSLY